MSHRLTAYRVRVKPVREAPLPLDDIMGQDFLELARAAIASKLGAFETEHDVKRCSRPTAPPTVMGRRMNGTMLLGEYGYRASIYHTGQGQETHDKEPDEAEVIPYFYSFFCPPGETDGIAMFQSFKTGGIKTRMYNVLIDHLVGIDPLLRLEIFPLAFNHVARQAVRQGTVKGIQFVKRSLPTEVTDVTAGPNAAAKDRAGHVSVRFATHGKGTMNALKRKVMKALDDGDAPEEIFALGGMALGGSQADKVVLELDLNGKATKVELVGTPDLTARYPFADDELDDDGHPTVETSGAKVRALEEGLFPYLYGVQYNAEVHDPQD